MDNVYLALTREFNTGRTRAILSSGQAVVVHRLAIMSKDGDWIVREVADCLTHILDVLGRHGARYRFGAPLDVRWLAGGWSSHFEFMQGPLRVRTDFVSRPPRIESPDLDQLWREQDQAQLPVVDVRRLAELKKTNREKDYAVIGELARRMDNPELKAKYSRSARDLVDLHKNLPAVIESALPLRPALSSIARGIAALEAALDAERRELMHANERRLQRYLAAAAAWAEVWPGVEREASVLPLREAHHLIVERAEGTLPNGPAG